MKHVVNAILLVDGQYLLQLREDKAGIADPGLWGTFGGHVDPGETIYETLAREVLEETSLHIQAAEPLGELTCLLPTNAFVCHLFVVDVSAQIGNFYCREGLRGGLFNYSALPKEMGKITRDILYFHHLQAKRAGGRSVLCHGVFDVLHYGHIRHLTEAKAFGSHLTVSLVADRFVDKGPGKPVFNEEQRMEVLEALGIVDKVLVTDAPGPFDHIRLLRPHFYVRGYDYKGRTLPEDGVLAEAGAKTLYTQPCIIHSSGVTIS